MNATQKGERSSPLDAHAAVVEEIVRTIFDALPTEELGEDGWLDSYRNATEEDLKKPTPEELADEFLSLRQFIESLCNTAEMAGVVAQMVHRDCAEWVEEAYRRARRGVREA
jgi:hypothetical protein